MRWRHAFFLAGTLAVFCGFWLFDAWRLRADWQQAKRDVAAGRPASALARLDRLAARRPENGEIVYDLGVCELARRPCRSSRGGVGASPRWLSV